jgi:Ala-tRNA(Pro) deacylase
MPVKRLKAFLEDNNVGYEMIPHPTAYTSAALGAVTHTPGKEIAKTVMINVDGVLAMVVVPGSKHVNLRALKSTLGAREVAIAAEEEFAHVFPDCEVGAMPPFGNLYGLCIYVDEVLTRDEEIAFNAGNHRELFRLKYKDFERLTQPLVVKVATPLEHDRMALAWNE